MAETLFMSSSDRPKVAPIKDPQRSRISNGSSFLSGIDNRGPWVRRAKDLVREHLLDLGGPDNTSAAERSIVRRAAVITAELENLETRFAVAGNASAEDLGLYITASNSLRRLLETLGLRRRPRDVTPSVEDYIEHLNRVAPKPSLIIDADEEDAT